MAGTRIASLVSLVMFWSSMLATSLAGNLGLDVITIGAILSTEEHGRTFLKSVETVNKERPNLENLPENLTVNGTYILMDRNPIRAAQSVCEELIIHKVYVVIASNPPRSDLSPMAVSFTCGYYKIPVIGISARESSFSDKNVHSAFMRTVPPYSEQAEVWVELLEYWRFKSIIFIHSSDQEGRAMLGKFQTKAEVRGIEIAMNVQYTSGQTNFTEELIGLQNQSCRVILLYATSDDAQYIFNDAVKYNLTGPGWVWVITEQAMKAANVPRGAIALQLADSNKEDAHIDDSVHIIFKALDAMYSDGVNITEAPASCEDEVPEKKMWKSGPILRDYMKLQTLTKGGTGQVKFNEEGDRVNSLYNILNKQYLDALKLVGHYNHDDSLKKSYKLSVNDDSIIWPGDVHEKPNGIKISTHLKVVTIEALPFVYVDPLPIGEKCDLEFNKIYCPRPNTTGGVQTDFCCYGYAIDLLVALSVNVSFTFELHLVEDKEYGSFEKVNTSQQKKETNGKNRLNGSSQKTWSGLIGEITSGQSDLIVAPLTIDPERARHIDFSKPFKYQGLTILVKKTTKDSSLASFLQPFQQTLWILVGLSVHVVALVLYLLDRFSPFGRFKLAKSDDTEEDALNLSSAMWFAWGVLLNSGIGEGTPRSFSARVLGMVWAGFAMIIVASYTANLAAFLVLDRPVAAISGIDDARLRNPQEDFEYATVKNSAVAMYFKRQVELSTMYRTMEGRPGGNYDSAEQAIEEVRKGDLQAFIWDSSRLEFEAANDCDLVTAGELFGRSGYGIGLRKNSPWTEKISLAILSFHETGYMEELDGKWILVKDTNCPEKDQSPATLGLTNMAGVFMMVAGGIVAGVFLIFIEIAYRRHRGLKEKELELAKTAADRWRGNIEKRRTLRRTLLQQQQERNKVTNGTTESPARTTRLPSYSPGSAPAGYQPVATNVETPDKKPSISASKPFEF